jgi:hypothetical protein
MCSLPTGGTSAPGSSLTEWNYSPHREVISKDSTLLISLECEGIRRMKQVTLRDCTTQQEIGVPAEGVIFGRTGGQADIQLEDDTLSKLHARVYAQAGQWFVEYLATPPGAQPSPQTRLEVGSRFHVGEHEYEVSGVDLPFQSVTNSGEFQVDFASPSWTSQFKWACVYYLLNVPGLVVNPVGSIRDAIDELPQEPVGRRGLVAYAFPAALSFALVICVADGMAGLLRPTPVFLIASFVPVLPMVASMVAAGVVGTYFHPVLSWFIIQFHGQTDERARTNFFLQWMSTLLVMGFAHATGTVLSALPVPHLPIVSLLLNIAACALALFMCIQWLNSFRISLGAKSGVLVMWSLGCAALIAHHVLRSLPVTAAPVAAPLLTASAPLPAVVVPEPSTPSPPESAAAATVAEPAVKGTEVLLTDAYALFSRRREAIDRLAAQSSSALFKNRELKKMYRAYLSHTYEAQKKWAKETVKKPARAYHHERLRDADIYAKTERLVSVMAAKLKLD